MNKYKILINGRTSKWYWQIQWCLNKSRMPAQQPWWLKAHNAWLKHHNYEK